MKYILLTLISLTLNAETTACIKATEKATAVHWAYVEHNATLKESYKATATMNKLCNLKG